MKTTKIAICISAFLLSLNAFGLEGQEHTRSSSSNQIPEINKVVFNQENLEVARLVGTDTAQHKVVIESPIKTQDIDFFTKICILLSISMVYWIHWLISTKPNKN
jgi:hypothetical protein